MAEEQRPNSMVRLTRDQILQAADVVEQDIDVPEWGGSVRIRTLTKADQIRMREEAKVQGEIDEDRLEVLLFIHSVIEPQFMPADFEALKQKSSRAMDRVLMAIYGGSGMTAQEVKQIRKSFRPGS